MNTHPAPPAPDAVLRALWNTDFDLLEAADSLDFPFSQLLLLLRQPAYAEPFEAMHEALSKCLDLRAAKSVGVVVDTLRTDLEACQDPAESRRIATALTKAVNAATRLTRDRATDRRSGRSAPDPATAAPPAPLTQATSEPRACPKPVIDFSRALKRSGRTAAMAGQASAA